VKVSEVDVRTSMRRNENAGAALECFKRL